MARKLLLDKAHIENIRLYDVYHREGGIVRCDLIAEGIIAAVKEVGVSVPVVVRLEGTNVNEGKEMLAKSGLAITSTRWWFRNCVSLPLPYRIKQSKSTIWLA